MFKNIYKVSTKMLFHCTNKNIDSFLKTNSFKFKKIHAKFDVSIALFFRWLALQTCRPLKHHYPESRH
jgi:hypothetical protein